MIATKRGQPAQALVITRHREVQPRYKDCG
jgi:hypothetical protein